MSRRPAVRAARRLSEPRWTDALAALAYAANWALAAAVALGLVTLAPSGGLVAGLPLWALELLGLALVAAVYLAPLVALAAVAGGGFAGHRTLWRRGALGLALGGAAWVLVGLGAL